MTNDEVEYRLLVSFPDESESFVHGFESGIVWAKIEAGLNLIEVTIHAQNEEVMRRMARARGYDIDIKKTDFVGWLEATLRKNRPAPHLSLVKP